MHLKLNKIQLKFKGLTIGWKQNLSGSIFALIDLFPLGETKFKINKCNTLVL